MEPLSQRTVIGAIAIILVLIAIAYFFSFLDDRVPEQERGEEEQVFCTLDAKLCPDGSYVGRMAPSCEFAACPGGGEPSTSRSVRIETRLGEGARALGVAVTPLAVLEDSRCPTDVVCIQAGTVRIRATLESALGSGQQVFELRKAITTEAEEVELVEVLPASSSGQTIQPQEYRFIFEIRKRFGEKG